MANKLYTTGITVKCDDNDWMATCQWQSNVLQDQGKTIGRMCGEVSLSYCDDNIATAIDKLLGCLKLMGIYRSDEIDELKEVLGFAIYYAGDESGSLKAKAEAGERGWKFYMLEGDEA